MGIGFAATGAAAALVLVALPLFFFAQAVDPARGTGRPFIRDGLVRVAIPVAVAVGALIGTLAGEWYRRGGRLDGPATGPAASPANDEGRDR